VRAINNHSTLLTTAKSKEEESPLLDATHFCSPTKVGYKTINFIILPLLIYGLMALYIKLGVQVEEEFGLNFRSALQSATMNISLLPPSWDSRRKSV
jgi:hypothetical protein